MWATVALMALAIVFEPARTAFVVLMLSRPYPVRQLLAFVACGFIICFGAGLIMLFALRSTPLSEVGSFSVSQVHVAIGVLALLIALVVATDLPERIRRRHSDTTRTKNARTAESGISSSTATSLQRPAVGSVAMLNTAAPGLLRRTAVRTRNFLRGESLWVAGASGLINLPSANYMAALAVILASGASPPAQIQALLAFNIVAFVLVGSPLLTYLAAPRKTRACTAALHAWLLSRRRRDVVAMVAALGSAMLVLGLSGL